MSVDSNSFDDGAGGVPDTDGALKTELRALLTAGCEELEQEPPRYRARLKQLGNGPDLPGESPVDGSGEVKRVYQISQRDEISERDQPQFSVATTLRVAQGWPGNLVVMVPGLGCTQESYATLAAAAVSQGYSVLTIDLPGHGETHELNKDDPEARGDGYSLLGCASAVTAVLNTFSDQVRDVSFMGHSLGASVALLSAGSPQLGLNVRGLVSVEGRTFADCKNSKDVAKLEARELSGYLATLPKDDAGRQAWIKWIGGCDAEAIIKLSADLVRWTGSDLPEAPNGITENRKGTTLRDMFFALGERAYFMVGSKSTVPGWAATDHNRRTSLIRIPGSGHFPMIDAPARFGAGFVRILDLIHHRTRGTEPDSTGG